MYVSNRFLHLEKQFSLFRALIKWKIPLENLWDCSYGNQIHVSQSVKSDSNLLIGKQLNEDSHWNINLLLAARMIPGTDRPEQEETRKECQLIPMRRLELYNWFIDSRVVNKWCGTHLSGSRTLDHPAAFIVKWMRRWERQLEGFVTILYNSCEGQTNVYHCICNSFQQVPHETNIDFTT